MTVTIARKAFLAAEWRDAIAVNTSIQSAHPLAVATVEESLLLSTADAEAEAARRLALRGVRWMRFEILVQLTDETDAIDLGDIIELAHPRFGLSVVGDDVGGSFRVLDVAPNARDHTLLLTLWGRARGRSNRVTTTGAYRVTSTGALRVTE